MLRMRKYSTGNSPRTDRGINHTFKKQQRSMERFRKRSVQIRQSVSPAGILATVVTNL